MFAEFSEQISKEVKPIKAPPLLALGSLIFKICASRCSKNAFPDSKKFLDFFVKYFPNV